MTEFIYVAEGWRGLMKVGRTKNPDGRRAGLAKEFMRRGEALVRFHACELCGSAYAAEIALIEAVSRRVEKASGREWFRHGNYGHAVTAALEIAEYYSEQNRNFKPYKPSRAVLKRLNQMIEDGKAARLAAVANRARRMAEKEQKRRVRDAGIYAFAAIAQAVGG